MPIIIDKRPVAFHVGADEAAIKDLHLIDTCAPSIA